MSIVRTDGTAVLPPIIAAGDTDGWRWAVLGQLALAVERIAEAAERQAAESERARKATQTLAETARRVERLLKSHPAP